MSRSKRKSPSPCGIEYVGLPGITGECKAAVMRLIQFGDRITRARILTHSHHHCLLLSVNCDDIVAVKSGFGSGYMGEGSHGFSFVLALLKAHGAEIEEHD